MTIKRRLLTVITLTALASCTEKLPSEEHAKDTILTRIDGGGTSKLKLLSFAKTDGVEAEFGGLHLYTMTFAATAEFVDDALFGNGEFWGMPGPAITTKPYRLPASSLDELGLSASGYRRARRGDKLILSGTIQFEQHESGWQPTEVQIRYTQDSSTRNM